MLASKYTMVADKIYKMGKDSPMLRCPSESETILMITQVNEGVRGSHIEGRGLVRKLLKVGCYWPNILKDNTDNVNKCDN